MFVGCSTFLGQVFLNTCPLRTHGGHPIWTLTCQNLAKMPGESWEWCSTMIQWSMTQPMSPCALRSNARKSKAVIVWCILGKGRQRWDSSWSSVWGVCVSRLLRRLLVVEWFSVLGTFAWTLVQDAPRWAWERKDEPRWPLQFWFKMFTVPRRHQCAASLSPRILKSD